MNQEIKQRQEAARNLLAEKDLSGLVLATPQNIQYFTGVTEPSVHTCGKVILAQLPQAVLAVLWLDQEAAKMQAEEASVEAYSPTTQGAVIAEILKRLGGAKGPIGMDSRALQVLENALRLSLPDAPLVNVSTSVEELRSVKSEEEVSLIKKACEIAEQGMKAAAESLKPGMTELQVAALAEHKMMMLGSDKLRHITGVASGFRASLPHAFATQKKIEAGDVVAIDLGAVYHGYCSDLARTFVVGEPGKELRDAFDTLCRAQDTVLGKLRPGITIHELQLIPREFVRATGHQMVGHMGHNIGLQVEEHPQLVGATTPDPNLIIRENNVLAFFQGSIRREEGSSLGIRLEDTVLVTASGAKMLTNYPRELYQIVPS